MLLEKGMPADLAEMLLYGAAIALEVRKHADDEGRNPSAEELLTTVARVVLLGFEEANRRTAVSKKGVSA
jgi:hypothetical protein